MGTPSFLFFTLLLASSLFALPCLPSAKSPSVIERVALSIGHIHDQIDGDESYCTAFAYAPGRYLTAAHCVGVLMTLDGVEAHIEKQDNERDLAIVSSPVLKPLLTLRDRPVGLFEHVDGLGYAYDMAFLSDIPLIVLVRNSAPSGSSIFPGIWFSGVLLSGMSGGAIVDKNGEVVGICQRAGVGVSYSVSVETIKKFLLKS